MCSTIALIVLCALTLILLLMVIFMSNDICAMKDLCERLRDKWAGTESLCKKLDVAIMWLIEEKGVTLEQSHSWVNPWYIAPLKDKWHVTGGYRRELNDIFSAIYHHREEIVKAIYEANMQSLNDWDKTKKKGGKK